MSNILVVDDDPLFLLQISSMLETLGHHPEGLSEPQHLFEILGHFSPELILLDVNMPGIDGITLLKQLKEHSDYRSIPVVMLTGEDTPRTLKECFQCGCIDFIGKPVQSTIFRARISAIVERSQMEQQLRLSQKMQALGSLSRGIAHDFNNILFAILGFSELLEEELDEKSQGRRYLENIIQSSNRAKKVVSQLLTFAQNQEEELSTPLLLLDTLESALFMVQASMSRNIEVQSCFDSEIHKIKGNEDQLYQVLINLCLNAKEAMQSGGLLKVGLESLCIEEAMSASLGIPVGKYQHVSVEDDGCGMSASVQERVFEPFFTTKGLGGIDSEKPKDGTGLGLYVVHNIVKQHQGFIQIHSQQDQGTTVHLYFPEIEVAQIPESSEALEQASDSSQKLLEKPDSSVKLRVLMAEDEPLVGELYTELLTMGGHEVTLCTDGAKALQCFSENPEAFDLLLTDQEMPELTGTELCAEVLKLQPDLPIILATGFSPEVSEKNYTQFGIQKFFTKPMDADSLLQSLQELSK